MRAAILCASDEVPVVAGIPDPVAVGDARTYVMRAAALTNLDLMIARGGHYLSPSTWPRGIGREGVATDPYGRRVYLNASAIRAPNGSMAELTLADPAAALSVPESVSDELAAAIGNPGLAAWLALSWRARLKPGEAVLVLGATGASGRIAVAAAAILGAGRVVAAGRNETLLRKLSSRGADAVVGMDSTEGDLSDAYRDAGGGGFDVVIDFVNGVAAETALRALNLHGRLIQVGSVGGTATTVPAQVARRYSLDVLGFAYYHAPIAQQADAYARLCDAAASGLIDVRYGTIPLDAVATAWASQVRGEGMRWVVQPGAAASAA